MIAEQVAQAAQMLKNLLAMLEKAEGYAKEKNFEMSVLLESRLAPDMFPLRRQIQACTDIPKLMAARLSGKDAPVDEDQETTIEELRERTTRVIAYLEGFSEADFANGNEQEIRLSFLPGKVIRGQDYFMQLAIPNFYFHMSAAYGILRHNGVAVGTFDIIGRLDSREKGGVSSPHGSRRPGLSTEEGQFRHHELVVL